MKAPTVTALLLFPVFALVFCVPEPLRKSRRDVSVGIINPNVTDISNFNYTVAINWYDSSTGYRFLGGGVLVSTNWVLTAAYNVDGYKALYVKVRVGSNSPLSDGKVYKVTKIVTHTSYIGNWTYDLSLLKLGSVVKPKFGSPVILAKTPLQTSGHGVVTGYGSQKSSKLRTSSGSSLEMANINLFDYETCDLDWYGTELSQGEICGYAPGVGPCHGDFGDPVADCDSEGSCTLLGMFSGSYGCADDHFPGIYMDIGYFYDWITENIK